jgi:hypothetical protein
MVVPVNDAYRASAEGRGSCGAEGHDVTYGVQELQRKDVSCPDKYTTKLSLGAGLGGVGVTVDLRGMQ